MVQTQEMQPPPPQPSSPPPQPQAAAPSGGQPTDENVLAGVAYILTWITGLIILLVAQKHQKKARWHAIQAIGFGIVWMVVGFIGSFFGAGMFAFGFMGFGGLSAIAMVFGLLSLAFLVLWIVLIVYGFTGKVLRLPVLSDLADKNA